MKETTMTVATANGVGRLTLGTPIQGWSDASQQIWQAVVRCEKVLGVHTVTVMVSPDLAAYILRVANGRNRLLRDADVARLSVSIGEGLWKVVHQGIGITAGGKLVDGQHRLNAIAAGSVDVPLTVTVGLPEDCFDAIDGGRVRTAVDIVQAAFDVTMDATLGGALGVIDKGVRAINIPLKRADVAAAFVRRREALAFVTECFGSVGKTSLSGIRTSAVLGVVGRAVYSQDKADLRDFCAALCDGRNIDGVLLSLRNYLTSRAKGKGSRADREDVYAVTQNALIRHLRGGEEGGARVIRRTYGDAFEVPNA